MFEVTPVSGIIYAAIFFMGSGLLKGIFDMVDSPTPKTLFICLYILERLVKLMMQTLIGVPTTSLVVVIYLLIYSFLAYLCIQVVM